MCERKIMKLNGFFLVVQLIYNQRTSIKYASWNWTPKLEPILYGYGLYLCSDDTKSPSSKSFPFVSSVYLSVFEITKRWTSIISHIQPDDKASYWIQPYFKASYWIQTYNTIICNLNDNMFDTIDTKKRSTLIFSSISFHLIGSFAFSLQFVCQSWQHL